MDAIVINVIIIACIGILGAFFGREDERVFTAFFALAVAFQISVLGWIVFIAHHFITKYW